MKSTVILITGYRRMGKDTLAQKIIANDNLIVDGYKYKINIQPLPSLIRPFYRIAIADTLKALVHANLGLKLANPREYERIKDKPLFNGRSLRDYYIEVGKQYRDLDPYYWIDKTIQRFHNKGTPIITDWRFPSEYTRLIDMEYKVLTMRITRKGVPIPPLDIESEHALDNFPVDIEVSV